MNLIAHIIKGDEAAFEKAFIQARGKVYHYFLKKSGSAEDSQDLTQITFFKLWNARKSLSAEFSLDQHLFNIARNVYIDFWRGENRKLHLRNSLLSEAGPGKEVAHPSVDIDLQQRVNSVLAAMPPARRKIFELQRIEGYSYQEIAELLSISVKAVDNQLAKALRQLRKHFDDIVIIFIILSGNYLF